MTTRVTEWFPAGDISPLGDGDYRVEFISHGTTRDGKRYYPKQVLEAAAKAGVFDGAKMYLNHSDHASDARRGHRDLRDWGATIKTGTVEVVEGNVRAVCHAHLQEAKAILDDPIAKASVGLSHDSYVKMGKKRIDGKDVQVVESIESCNSVDFVPTGNANGRVLEAAHNKEQTDMELSELTVEQLREARPDLIELLTPKPQTVVAQVAEPVKVAEAGPDVAAEFAKRDAEISQLRESLMVRDTQAIVAELVTAAEGLSDSGKQRVKEQFAGIVIPATEIAAKVAEAIEKEKAYALQVLREAGVVPKVTGLGTSGGDPTQVKEAYKNDLKSRLEKMGYDAKTIEAMMGVRS